MLEPPFCSTGWHRPCASLRRLAVPLLMLLLMLPPVAAQTTSLPVREPAEGLRAAWRAFTTRHVNEGRVVDSGQAGITHSEGQGAALLAAATVGDREAFDRMWAWTRERLAIRPDGLLAWRWTPGHGVTDSNNATDGDLFVVWALVRAGQRWPDSDHHAAAARMAVAIRTHLVQSSEFGPVLLPGRDGFLKPEGPILNLSYWLFPAFEEINRVDPDPVWPALAQSGQVLLGAARYGRWQLPADWVQVRGRTLALAPGFPQRFGNDAIRIPLYLRWAGLGQSPVLGRCRDFWRHFTGAEFLPAWTLLTDDSIDSYDASPGHRGLVAWLGGPASPAEGMERAMAHSYYSGFLTLMRHLAEPPPQ